MADITTSQVFTDGERGITATKMNAIIGGSVIQPAFYTAKPVAGSADPADIALIVKAGAYAQVPISALAGSATQAQIWSTRLNSYNAARNSNFEIDSRNAGANINNIANGAFVCDRFFVGKVGTHTFNTAQESGATAIPGTTFTITQKRMLLQIATAQASMTAADYFQVIQSVEGPDWREIAGGPFSVSLLVYSDVALKFSFGIRGSSLSLVKLCTVPAAAWTIVQLPNIPAPTTAFPLTPGVEACKLTINLSCGTTNTASSADAWVSGNFTGCPGMDNWSSKPVNTGFRVGAIQLEPGAVCSTLMDLPFSANLDQCLRFYQKTYDYDVAVGTASAVGYAGLPQQSTTLLGGAVRFHKPMAKIPTMTGYSTTGAINSIRLAGADYAATGFVGTGKAGFYQITTATLPAVTAGSLGSLHYIADTGM